MTQGSFLLHTGIHPSSSRFFFCGVLVHLAFLHPSNRSGRWRLGKLLADSAGINCSYNSGFSFLLNIVFSFNSLKKADASKTTTLEADVKPQAAAPLPDDKKPAAKSPFFSFFKPKVLMIQINQC